MIAQLAPSSFAHFWTIRPFVECSLVGADQVCPCVRRQKRNRVLRMPRCTSLPAPWSRPAQWAVESEDVDPCVSRSSAPGGFLRDHGWVLPYACGGIAPEDNQTLA